MPSMGVEPILLTELEPKSSVSANFTKRTNIIKTDRLSPYPIQSAIIMLHR